MADRYWDDKGQFQDEYNELWERLVPDEGRARTTHGELLRCASRIYYDHYNNGRFNMDMDHFTDMIRFIKSWREEIAANIEKLDPNADPYAIIENYCAVIPEPEADEDGYIDDDAYIDCDDVVSDDTMTLVMSAVIMTVRDIDAGVSK